MKRVVISAFFCVMMLAVFLDPRQVNSQSCPDAPRNTFYSANFFRAEAYFLNKAKDFSSSANIMIEGVPIGGDGNFSAHDSESRSLTETQAYTFIQEELKSHGAQIVAECAATLCRLGTSPNGTINENAAISAVEHICLATLPNAPGVPPPSDQNAAFRFLRDRPTIIFNQAHTTPQPTVLYIANNTPGTLHLKLAEADLKPEDRNKNIRFTGRAMQFTLRPNERKPLPFRIIPPNDKFQPVFGDVLVSAVNDNRLTAVSHVTVAYVDVIGRMPEILTGQLRTNAEILCTALDLPPFHANWLGLWRPLSFFNAFIGPNMEYSQQTECHALSRASADLDTKTWTGTTGVITLEHKTGATCGPAATGGMGTIEPTYKTQITVPQISPPSTWTLHLDTQIESKGLFNHGQNTGVPRACTLSVSGNGQRQEVAIPRNLTNTPLEIKGLKGGAYDVTFSCPQTDAGCFGAPHLQVEGTQRSTLTITVSRSGV